VRLAEFIYISYSYNMKNGGKKFFFVIIGSIAIIAGILVGLVMGIWIKGLPPVESLAHYKPDVVTLIYDNSEDVVGEFFTERRIPLKRCEFPDSVIRAILAAEDAEFYQHSGFDLPGIVRAFLTNLKNLRISQGASTITQQLARMLFLTNEKSFIRKIKEAILAVKIERYYSKDEILTLYLNLSYFGHGAYGIQSASYTFYDKPVSDINLAQCAMLMGLLKNPSYFSPVNHLDRALSSRNRIIDRMLAKKLISTVEHERLVEEDSGVIQTHKNEQLAPYFIEEIRKQLVNSMGNKAVLTGGLKVYSTLDADHQRAANLAVAKGIQEFQDRQNGAEEIQAALVAIRPGTGEITAMVGGRDFEKSKFNRAVQALRQSGSAIKPFVYLTGFLNGMKPSDIVIDEPIRYVDPQSKQVWKPRNYDRKFHGPVTLRHALEKSLNVSTVKVLEKVGIDATLDTIRKVGIETELPPYMSVGLGSGEVTLLELTNAYATLAGGGIRAKPTLFKRICDQGGKILENEFLNISEEFDERYCFQITCLLQGVVQSGTGWRARKLDLPVAAKTGTTNDCTDAWFVGYTPSLAVGVWVGYDLKRTMGKGETGSRAAGPIFVDFLEQISTEFKNDRIRIPDGIVEVQICSETGFLPNNQCPKIIKEVFLENAQPHQYCPIHLPVPNDDLESTESALTTPRADQNH